MAYQLSDFCDQRLTCNDIPKVNAKDFPQFENEGVLILKYFIPHDLIDDY